MRHIEIYKNDRIKLYMTIVYIFGFITLIIAYMSALHGIDLSWNAVRIEGLIDDNGIIKQTPETIYLNSFRFLSWFPVLIMFPMIGMILIYEKV